MSAGWSWAEDSLTLLLCDFSCNIYAKNEHFSESHWTSLSQFMSSLLAPCPRPLLCPSVCSPFFWYLLHKKTFTHSSATFLRHSKKGRILVISSSSLRALHSQPTLLSVPLSFFFFFFFCVFLVYLDCRNWGKAEYLSSSTTCPLI